MKKCYSIDHLKHIVAGAAMVMAITSVSAPMVQAETFTVNSALTEPYILDGADSLTITTDGSIKVDGLFSTMIGVGVTSDLAGSVNNSGAISVTADVASGSSSAMGIALIGDLIGTITNSGTINAKASHDNSSGTAYGILTGNLSGTGANIINSGTITVEAMSFDYTASAFGVDTAVLSGAGASITNSGTINVKATALEDYAYAWGISTNNLDGAGATITNKGTITVEANGFDYATAYGIETYDLSGASASISNSGTINVKAVTIDSEASAYGIYTGDLSGTGASITNSGTLKVEANGFSSATAYGIEAGELSGTGASITNSGTINVKAVTIDSEASAYGIYTGDLSGAGASITNSGTLNVEANGLTSATAYGIEAGELSGTGASITNSGTINIKAVTLDSSASAYGIYTSNMGDGTSIINTGTITVKASTSVYSASAYGIETGSLDEGASITNSGTIAVEANGHSSASAYGIYTGELGIGASITNKGAITATALSLASDAYAFGIETDLLDENASIINSGTITVKATGYDYASATGIDTDANLNSNASITNSGTINVTAISYNKSATANGIDTANLLADASITNSGTITATATGFTEAYAMGITTGSLDEGASITNSGVIDVSAQASHGTDVTAAGIMIDGTLGTGASVTNSGTIIARADGLSAARAFGIAIEGVADGASITNSGTIYVEYNGTAGEGAGAAGILLTNLDENDSIVNSGTITAIGTVNDKAYSIYIDNNSGTGGTVTNNGTLNGNIYLGADGEGGNISLDNNGTLAIPALAEGASGLISGDYTQSADGIFKVGVNSGAEYGRMAVGGTATLSDNANIRADVAPGNTLVAGDVLAIIDASESDDTLITSTFNVMDNSLAWQFSAANEENILNLRPSATGMSTYVDAVSRAGLSSGAGVAGVLDDFYANGAPNSDFDDLLYVLGSNDTPAEVADDVSKLMPLMSGGLSQVTFNAMHGAGRIIQSRLAANQGLSFGDEVQPDRQMWVKPFGSWTDQDDADGAIGYDADTYGVVFGADTEIGSSFRLGAAFAYSASDVDSNSSVAPQNADIDTYQFAFYGSYSIDAITEINFQADIGTSSYDGVRTISFDSFSTRANSDFDSTNYHLGVGLGRDIKIDDKNTFTPSVRADYTAIDTDSYTETGAGSLGLRVEGETYDELIFAVDGKINHELNDTVSLTGNLGLGLDAINDQGSITSSFVGGGGTFVTDGVDPSALLFRGGLGLMMQPVNGIELVARYDLEAREDFANHTVSMKFRMPF